MHVWYLSVLIRCFFWKHDIYDSPRAVTKLFAELLTLFNFDYWPFPSRSTLRAATVAPVTIIRPEGSSNSAKL